MILRTISAAILAFPLLASATVYTEIDNTESLIEFHYEQMGVKMEGVFANIEGEIHYDSQNPEQANATLNVVMNSVDTGSSEADGEIIKKEWFDAKTYPEATFITKKITKKSDNEFEITGLLEIKGHEQEIHFPATVTESDSKATFTGRFSLLRGDYAVGEGAWSKFDIVANDISIDFIIVATE